MPLDRSSSEAREEKQNGHVAVKPDAAHVGGEHAADDIDEPALEAGAEEPEPLPVSRRRQELAAEVATHALLAFMTIWGVLARLGLTWIGGFGSASVFPLLWAQLVGCFLMGFFLDKKGCIERVYKPLFTAFTTGFCGSLTTFSSFAFDVFEEYANVTSSSRSRFSSFMNGTTQTLLTVAVCLAFLSLGKWAGRHLPTPHPSPPPEQLANAMATIVGVLAYLGAILLVALGPQSWRHVTFAIVLGPWGTFARYHLSRRVNPRVKDFPLGTFTANIVATALLAGFSALQRTTPARFAVSCAVLQGLDDGFCGSLSTVSTWVVELQALSPRKAWRYGFASWAAGVVISVLIFGSWYWGSEPEALRCI